jgi:hypothetical protein
MYRFSYLNLIKLGDSYIEYMHEIIFLQTLRSAILVPLLANKKHGPH